MADFLKINGIVVPCLLEGGGDQGTETIGESRRAVDGTMLEHRRVTKNRWDFSLKHQVAATAYAFRDLLLGKGHYISFDAHLYSSKGLPPSSNTGCTYLAGGAYIGAGRLQQAATTGTITYTALPVLAGGPWTVVHARKVAAGAWNHYVTTSAGTVWTNGAVAGATAWLVVTPAAGTVQLAGDFASTAYLDEVVILPYVVPDDWPAQIYTMNNAGTQWSSLFRLNAQGEAIEANTRTISVKGDPGKLRYHAASLTAGSFTPNVHTMPFSLEEV